MKSNHKGIAGIPFRREIGGLRKMAKLDGLKDFTRLHKRVTVFVTVGILVAVGAIIVLFIIQRNNSSKSPTTYREYTVSRGDVTVGTSETGTVALDSQSVAFPVACKVGAILVKSGATVKKGTPLVRLDLNSVADGSSDTKQKLEAAKVSLQSAMNDQKAKLDAAKITYESSKYLATSAPLTRQMTVSELQHNITAAQTTLKNDQTSLATYQSLLKSYDADNTKLKQLETWMNDANTAKTSYTNQLSKFNDDNSAIINKEATLKKAMNDAETAYYQSKYNDDDDATDAKATYDDAKDAYNDYYNDIAKAVLDQQKALEDKVAQATAAYSNYSTAYTNYKSDFSDKYKSNADSLSKTDLAQKVSSLQATVQTDEYNLEKAQKTAEISSVTAQTTEATDLNTAKYADDAYALTVNQLQEAVSVAQDSYDKMQREMDEINNAMNGNGVIAAPCDGIVAEIAYTAGKSVEANTAILTLSSTDSVSMSASISEDDITGVKIGQDASITLSSYDNESFDAVVESITAEPARSGSSSVTYTVVVKSKEKVGDIGTVYDGMSGEVTVIQKRAKDALYVNDKAITFHNGISTVLVKNSDGTHTTKTVKTGFSNGTNVEVTSGLEKGDTVLVESAVNSK